MAAVFNSITSRLSGTTSQNFTPSAASNVVALIAIEGGVGGSVDNVNSVAVDGNQATLIRKIAGPTALSDEFVYLFIYPLGTTSGSAHTIQIGTTTGSPSFSVATWSTASQSTMVDASSVASTAAITDLSLNITTVANNAVIVAYTVTQSGLPTYTAPAGMTVRANSAGGYGIGDSTAVTPAATVTVTSHDATASKDQILILASLAPAVSVNANFLAFM